MQATKNDVGFYGNLIMASVSHSTIAQIVFFTLAILNLIASFYES